MPTTLHPNRSAPPPELSSEPLDETLVTEIVGAVLSLEYGAVTVSVKGGRVVRLERHEKLRLSPRRPA